jgi:SpoVK/Ycf46/Vps4 family AAA+-type ATPase
MEQQTQLEKVVEACRKAYQAKIPVIYLITDEPEIAREVKKDLSSETGQNIPVKIHSLLDNEWNGIEGRIKDWLGQSKNAENFYILASAVIEQIPVNCEPYVEVIKVPYLEDWEIEDIIRKEVQENEQKTFAVQAYLDKLTVSFRGFSRQKIRQTLSRIRIEMGAVTENAGNITDSNGVRVLHDELALKIIQTEKQQQLEKQGGILSAVEPGNFEVGGLQELQKWINDRKKVIANTKTIKDEWNINPPKGVLVSDLPGSGKSLMAKKTAEWLGVPLFRLDTGLLMNKYQGESEANTRRVIELVEAMSPCVLWIDELEKAFSGATSGSDSDSGTFKRMFGLFLNWMQERKQPCVIFATANDISRLPSEFLRRGRLDKKFYVFMPEKEECVEIFRAKIKERNKIKGNQGELFDKKILSDKFINKILDYCAEQKKFLTGSDIEGLIEDAMLHVFLTQEAQSKNSEVEDSIFTEGWRILPRNELDNVLSQIKSEKQAKEQAKTQNVNQLLLRYPESDFEAALKHCIGITKTYSDTNLTNIAQCYISMRENEFSPASANAVIDFSTFNPDEDPAIDIETLKDSKTNDYDKKLVEYIAQKVNVVCKQAQQQSKK